MISNEEYNKLLDQQLDSKNTIAANKIISGTILKISERKQEISALIFDKKRNGVIYSQSQYVSKIPKMLDPFIPNLPYRFSDYKILAYNLEKQSTKVLVDLPSQNIIGVVERKQTMPILSHILIENRNNRNHSSYKDIH